MANDGGSKNRGSWVQRLLRRSDDPVEPVLADETDPTEAEVVVGTTQVADVVSVPEYTVDGEDEELEPVKGQSLLSRILRRSASSDDSLEPEAVEQETTGAVTWGSEREDEAVANSSEQEPGSDQPSGDANYQEPQEAEAAYQEAYSEEIVYEDAPEPGRFASLTKLLRRSGSSAVDEAVDSGDERWPEEGEAEPREPRPWFSLASIRDALSRPSARTGSGPGSGRSLDWKTVRGAVEEALRPPTITLSFEGDTVRLVLIKGREVVAWGVADLPSETALVPPDEGEGVVQPEGSGDVGEGATEGEQVPESARAESLRQFLEAHDVRGGKVITDVPLYGTLLRHLKLPQIPRRYLKQVVTAEIVNSIPFSEDEVEISWQPRTDESGSAAVFAIAVPRETIDSHAEILDLAGARPRAAYSKAVALALGSGVPNAIVVDVKDTEAAIVLVRNQTPQVVHQLALRSGEVTPRQLAEEIAGGVEQMAGFYQDYQAFEAAGASEALPVVLTGTRHDQLEVSEALQRVMQREVLPSTPDLDYPEYFSPDEYAVNLGLALASQVKSKAGMFATGDPAINILPEKYLPRPIPAIPIGVFALLFVLGAAAAVATTNVSSLSAEANELESDVERSTRIFSIGEKASAHFHEESLIARDFADKIQSRLTVVRENMAALVARLDLMVDSARPAGVRVPSIAPIGDEFLVGGTAPTYNDVLTYADNIRRAGLFDTVVVEGVQGSGIGETVQTVGPDDAPRLLDFQIKATVKTEDEEGAIDLLVP